MNPAELNALRARFPELQGVATGQVAGGFSQAAAPEQSGPRTFAITGPDGKKYRVTGGADATPEAAVAAVKKMLSGEQAVEATNPFAKFRQPATNPFEQFRQPATGGNADGPTADQLLNAAENATAAGDTNAARRLALAALPKLDNAGLIGDRIQSGEVTSQQLLKAAENARNAGDTGAAERLERVARIAALAQGGAGTGANSADLTTEIEIAAAAAAAKRRRMEGPQDPPPAYDGVSAVPTAPRPDTFGDTTGEAIAQPWAATKAFGAGLLDQTQSPTMQALPDGMNPRLKGIVAGAGDLGGMLLGGLGTGLAGAAGLAGEAIGQTQTEERQLARDLMMGLEVSAPELAGVSGTVRAGGAAVRAAEAVGKPAKPGQLAARAAGDLGITPSAGMSGKTTAMIAAGLEKVPFAGDVIARDAARAVGEMENVFSRIRGSIGTALSSSAAGSTLQKGLQTFVKGFQETSGKLFDVVDRNIPATSRFKLDNTAAALGEARTAFEGNPELAARLGVNRWDAILAEAQQNGVSWQAFKQFRTSVGEAIGAAQSGRQGGALAGDDLGRLKRLYGALTADMTAAAKSVGENAFKTWTRANSHYRAGAERIERSLDATITAQSPERAWEAFSALLQRDRASSDLTRVRAIRASLSREDWDTVAASIVDRMGRAPAGQQNAAGDAFSPSAFLTNWNKLDPQSRALLLPQEARIELEKLAQVAERVRAGNAERNTSNTGTAGWLATLFLGGVTDLGTTAAVLGGTNLSARALTSTTFLKAMNSAARGDTKMLKAMANGNGPFKTDAATIIRLAAADQAAPQPQPEARTTLRVTGPDGTTFNVNVRANASPGELEAAIRQAIAQRSK